MERKDHIDAAGAALLTAFALLLAFNQVVIKVTTGGLQPVFFAGLRSAGAALCLWGFFAVIGRPLTLGSGRVAWFGVLTGVIFGLEFLALFIALDLTTVARTSVLFYSMPVWALLTGHFVLKTDRITPIRALGLGLAVVGVALAMAERQGGTANIWGDIAAVAGAMGWAATMLLAKHSPLSRLEPEGQLFWQVAISAPVLFVLMPFFGPLIRDLAPIHLAGLAFQIIVVVAFGFTFWLYVLRAYPASGVASFAFLSPVLAVGLGWLLLGEHVSAVLVLALCFVALGIVLINRRPALSVRLL